MNLSWKLAAVLQGSLPEQVLETYEVERKPHAYAMIKLARLVGAAMTRGGRTGDVLRRVVAPRLHWFPGLRQRLLDSETPALAHCALVAGPRRSLAGRLCPNAELEDGGRFDDVADGSFVLVSAVAPTAPQHERLAGAGVTLVLTAPGSALHTWLARGRATAALVRPDHTVLTASRDVAAVVAAVPGSPAARDDAGVRVRL
jgi:3-(3-hydroxy-phenyl)propionate hydroxylase